MANKLCVCVFFFHYESISSLRSGMVEWKILPRQEDGKKDLSWVVKKGFLVMY